MSILRYLVIATLTFLIGLLTVPDSRYIRTSLSDISSDVSSFDGKLVEVETYAQVDPVFDGDWIAGEPFEKREIFTFLKLATASQDLQKELAADVSELQYNRVKVTIRGRVKDNCAQTGGITTCCFGSSMTLENATMRRIGMVERYSRPTP